MADELPLAPGNSIDEDDAPSSSTALLTAPHLLYVLSHSLNHNAPAATNAHVPAPQSLQGCPISEEHDTGWALLTF
jgi:hypothetical protein